MKGCPQRAFAKRAWNSASSHPRQFGKGGFQSLALPAERLCFVRFDAARCNQFYRYLQDDRHDAGAVEQGTGCQVTKIDNPFDGDACLR